MLALHLPRCLFHSSRYLQIRTLRTIPRKIPTYTRTFNPTLHEPPLPVEPISTDEPAASLQHASTRGTLSPRTSLTLPWQSRRCDSNNGGRNNAGGRRIEIAQVNQERTRCRPYTKFKQVAQLVRSAGLKSDELRRRFWKVYNRAKSADPHFVSTISNRDWKALWNIQAAESEDQVKRALRLVELFDDMASVGISSTWKQRAEHLESSIALGTDSKLAKQWKGEPSTLGFRLQPSKPEQLEMKARLHAHAGNLAYARKIIDKLFDKHHEWDPSVIITVFRLHTSSTSIRDNEAAEEMYDETKARLGDNMTLELYDAFLHGFQEARRLESAKQVFVDMIGGGCLATSESAEDLNQVLKRLHVLYSIGLDMSVMSNIITDAIKVLPAQYLGRLFGDWMQVAVIEQAPEAASQIFDTMLQRGFMPDTYHFNMLIRALLRTQQSPNVLKAENIGWQMINEARKAYKSDTKLGSSIPKTTKDRSIRRSHDFPPANVTTFALIMHHHAKKLQWEYVEYLLRQLKESQIRPNTTMMNVLMHNKTRQGAYMETWLIYKELTNPPDDVDITAIDLFPNGATIRHLWVVLRFALADPEHQGFTFLLPSPEKLLLETRKWWRMCQRRPDASRFHLGLAGADHGGISALMLHCFSYTQDLPGTLIALHVLRLDFNIYPTPREVDIIKRHLAWIDPLGDDADDQARFEFRKAKRIATEQVEQMWQIVLEQRLKRMGLTVDEARELKGDEGREFGINLLSEVIRVVLKRRHGAKGAEKAIKTAGENAGFRGTTGDMTAYEVA
ncbi:hypothetical protein BDU57DRAFT_523048 [Ampelomyces quisqualis]|uniref:Pentatricopeptide repeat protein n=1 Tax=Ampelomyces quisqualis TaxID=50730 RepID=A0A6A5QDV5_AMPQU|nr:hypothetical protein BDU57DRAFT_523048 [Ampelomyces quisqualis]